MLWPKSVLITEGRHSLRGAAHTCPLGSYPFLQLGQSLGSSPGISESRADSQERGPGSEYTGAASEIAGSRCSFPQLAQGPRLPGKMHTASLLSIAYLTFNLSFILHFLATKILVYISHYFTDSVSLILPCHHVDSGDKLRSSGLVAGTFTNPLCVFLR